MRYLMLSILTIGLITFSITGVTDVSVHAEVGNEVKLTKEQRDEISLLHKNVIEQKKEIVRKYVEYGVISKTKGEFIISRLEKKYAKLEENGFIPKKNKSKKHQQR